MIVGAGTVALNIDYDACVDDLIDKDEE